MKREVCTVQQEAYILVVQFRPTLFEGVVAGIVNRHQIQIRKLWTTKLSVQFSSDFQFYVIFPFRFVSFSFPSFSLLSISKLENIQAPIRVTKHVFSASITKTFVCQDRMMFLMRRYLRHHTMYSEKKISKILFHSAFFYFHFWFF